jgi:hypothetical protein
LPPRTSSRIACRSAATGGVDARPIRISSARSSGRPARKSVASSRVMMSTWSRVTVFDSNQRRRGPVFAVGAPEAASDTPVACAICIGISPWSRRRSTISASFAASSSPMATSPAGLTAR